MKQLFEKAKIISGYSQKEAERRLEILQERFSDENIREHDKFEYLIESMMLTQVIMLKAEAKRLEELQAEVDEELVRVYTVVPKGDDMKYWLDKYGRREWIHRVKKEFNAVRSYHWCNRVIIMKNRTVTADITFDEFIEHEFDFYTPVLPEPGKEIMPQA